MGLMLLRKMMILFLLVSASFLSTSAVRRSQLMKNLVEQLDEEHGTTTVHERFLRVSTKDYGEYDSAPTVVRPPFKLIPN
ncbi:hypothetical protein K2173_013534 [Erythroxylum novogranatense]|uniref:Uncharacterized protein n=1 Tax=Erythroxylum novogranatense TaxID=1862640 RepID=A0AAV8TJL5_9ROSI|nr:hypothetical protein K2173_013534 [Erythroxylum novogranatense]